MEDWRYKIAKRRVKKVKGFFSHLTTWLIFSAFFIMLNVTTSPFEFWAIFPIMGWGLGVAFHAIGVFGIPGLGKDWEERMIEKEMTRLEKEEYNRQHGNPAGRLPYRTDSKEEQLELKEVRKEWRDQDLV